MYNINKLEKKNNDWIIADLTNAQGQTQYGVSINRTSKDGKVFPNFDGLKVGGSVDGNFWASPAGKKYLFAPDELRGAPQNFKGAGVAKNMERKEQSIEKFQDNKEHSIMVASSFTMAKDILIAQGNVGDDYMEALLKIRYQLVKNWNNTESPKTSDGSEMPNFDVTSVDPF